MSRLRRSGVRSVWAGRALPDLALARRLDEVEVIGEGLALKAAGGPGLRPIAEHLGVPHTTGRTWWRRFRVRSPAMLSRCTALGVSLNGTAVMVNTTGERAALAALGVAWQRAQVRFGDPSRPGLGLLESHRQRAGARDQHDLALGKRIRSGSDGGIRFRRSRSMSTESVEATALFRYRVIAVIPNSG
jgi:hypothetical protein